MPFSWPDFVDFADELHQSRSDEAALRSAISRAYYGAFGATRGYCQVRFDLKSGHVEIHQQIINSLKTSDISDEYSLGNMLSGLRKERNDADYESQAIIKKQRVGVAISTARRILSSVKSLREKLF